MACTTESQVYGIEEKNLLRITCIHGRVATRVLLFVFQNGSPRRSQYLSLLEYYQSEGVSNFAKGLSTVQKDKVKNDREGNTFDITLLFKCLRYGSHGLAKDDESWKAQDKDNASIESLISIVKNKRNDIAHGDHLPFTNEKLIEEASEVQDILTKILEFSGQKYGLQPATVSHEIDEMKSEIHKYLHGALEEKTAEDYKKALYFESHSELVNEDGVRELIQHYDMSYENNVSTVNHLVKVQLPLNHVYTEMKLREELSSGQEITASYENLLCDQNVKKTNDIIVIDGMAGTGKTTLTKKIVYDWKVKQSGMKHLDSYDLLLKTECRNSAIKSFDDLLHHLMPKVSNQFRPGDLKKVVLAQTILVILDGLDELNESSSNLFREILDLKTHFAISLLITTRPEKLDFVNRRGGSHQLRHIQLLGIPLERRDEFVGRYHSEIAKQVPHLQNIQGLLNYLKTTEHRLADLWRLPYNLALLTILWAYDHMNVTKINTAPELYREMFKLYQNKLKERLQVSTTFGESVLQMKIDYFLHGLCKESLRGLIHDQVNLPQEAYYRLEELCRGIQVPIEEMIGAFLQQVPSQKVAYSFPHKGLQDFLAAMYIFLEISGKDKQHDIERIMRTVFDSLIQENVSPTVTHTIIRAVRHEITKSYNTKERGSKSVSSWLQSVLGSRACVIRNLLEEIHSSSKYDLAKFQNMLFCLIGIFYSEKVSIKEEVRLEALELLQLTGMKDGNSWIRILTSVKCDEYIASFISKQQKIFSGNIQISDSSLSAYIALMKSLRSPPKDARTVKIDISIKEELTGGHELLYLINSFQMKIKRLLITKRNYKEYTDMLKKLPSSLKEESKVEVDIITDDNLCKISGILTEINQRNFKVRKLQVNSLFVLDSNINEYVAILKSLPQLSPEAHQTEVFIEVTGDLSGADELLELLAYNHFIVRSLLLNDNNFMKYCDLLSTMNVPLRDEMNLRIDLQVNEDILQLDNLMNVIKKHKFQLRKFKIKDFVIDDQNIWEYISAFEKMPTPLTQSNQTYVDIEATKDIAPTSNFLNLININQFKVKRFLVTEENFTSYTVMLEETTSNFKVVNDIEMHLVIDRDIVDISRLITEIRKKRFTIHTFRVRDFQVNDSNSTMCLLILRSLSPKCRNDDKPNIDIAIEDGKRVTDDLLHLISFHSIKVNSILITDSNLQKYVNLLAQLKQPLRDSRNVNIDICVTLDILNTHDLLTQVQYHGFRLQRFDLGIRNLEITSDNVSDYILVLESLPKLEQNSYEGNFHIHNNERTQDIDIVLQNIARKEFRVDIMLHYDFKNPTVPTVSSNTLNVIFEKCGVKSYAGRIFQDTVFPRTLKRLWASVPDTSAYIQLRKFLDTENELLALSVCASLDLETEKINPLPGKLKYPPTVYIPDVKSVDDLLKAISIIKQITPSSGFQELAFVFFPRIDLKEKDLSLGNFIEHLKNLRVRKSFVLPKAFHLPRAVDEDISTSNVQWGSPNGAEVGKLSDIDSW